MKAFVLTVVLVIGAFLSGCSHYETPAFTELSEPIKEFKSTQSIAVVNGQPSTEETEYLSNGIHSWYANLNKWTDVAVDVTKKELSKRGMSVTSSSGKKLTLAFISCNSDMGMWSAGNSLMMTVSTSDGYKNQYTSTASIAWVPKMQDHIDYLASNCVVQMLNDPKIIAFLTK